jgi:hypothetical protein
MVSPMSYITTRTPSFIQNSPLARSQISSDLVLISIPEPIGSFFFNQDVLSRGTRGGPSSTVLGVNNKPFGRYERSRLEEKLVVVNEGIETIVESDVVKINYVSTID